MRMRPGEIPAELKRLSDQQCGLLTIEQALAGGLKRRTITRRLKRGTWKLEVGCLVLDPTIPPFPARMGRAQALWGGEGSIVSGRTALALQGHDLRQILTIPRLVLVPRRPGRANEFARQVRCVDGIEPPKCVSGIPLRHVADIVLDILPLIDTASRTAIVDTATQLRWLTPDRMRRAIDTRVRKGARHATVLHAAALRVGTGLDSEAEAKCLEVLAAAGLVGFEPGFVVEDPDGRPFARIDLAHVPLRVAIEIDGWKFHGNPRADAEDKARQVELSVRGWRVLRFTWGQLIGRSAWVVQSVRRALDLERERLDGRGVGQAPELAGDGTSCER